MFLEGYEGSDLQGTACYSLLIPRDGPPGHPFNDDTVNATPTEMLEGGISPVQTKDVELKPRVPQCQDHDVGSWPKVSYVVQQVVVLVYNRLRILILATGLACFWCILEVWEIGTSAWLSIVG